MTLCCADIWLRRRVQSSRLMRTCCPTSPDSRPWTSCGTGLALHPGLVELFRRRKNLLLKPDCRTREVLECLLARPGILTQPAVEGLIEVQIELLRVDWEAEPVGKSALALVSQIGSQLSNSATAWSYSADALLDVVLLLQQSDIAEAQGLGVSLLESLVAHDFGEVDALLVYLDRRIPESKAVPTTSRRPPR